MGEIPPPWPRWHFRFPGRAQTREDPCKLFGGPNHEPISRNCIRDLPLRASSAAKALSPVAQSPDRTWTVRFHIFGPNVRSRWAGRIDCTSYIYYFDSSLFFCVTFGCSLTPLFENKNFGSIIMGVVAAVITTRSWLISEETITRYYSIYLTRIIAFILILYVIAMLLQ